MAVNANLPYLKGRLEIPVAQQVAETKTSEIPATGRFVVKGILMTVILPLDLACQIVSAS